MRVRQANPPATCRKCPRLVAFRKKNRALYPDFHNAPVRIWGAADAPLLIVGLAPGLKGANRTGQPFTGDASGGLLFASLIRLGLARETQSEIELQNCAITNAVACLPPENKPIGAEVANCRPYLTAQLAGRKAVLALGRLAHDATLKALNLKLSEYPFSHGAVATLPELILVSSFHPSRYNVSTKRITAEMLDAAVAKCLPS